MSCLTAREGLDPLPCVLRSGACTLLTDFLRQIGTNAVISIIDIIVVVDVAIVIDIACIITIIAGRPQPPS